MDQYESSSTPKKHWRDYVCEILAQWNCIGKELAISVWALSLCLVIATLMVGHWVTLPHPEPGEQFKTHEVSLLRSNADTSDADTSSNTDGESNVDDGPAPESGTSVRAYHFLYEDCPCSRRVLRHMLGRSPIEGATERIVLIGDTASESENRTEALTLGYQVDAVAPRDLKARYGVESAPLLVVTDKTDQILYSGGYTGRKQGPDIRDASIVAAIVAGEHVVSLPVYGCAVSKELQAVLDPLRLKYVAE